MNEKGILFDQEPISHVLVFNPEVKHWYLDTNEAFPMETYPTKRGSVIPKSLKKTKNATQYFAVNIEHFTSYDVLFLKDDQEKIGVFSMVATNQEFGNFYRSDHNGFGYKHANIYIDINSYHRVRGAQHYLTTEDLSGKWSLVCLYHPQDYIEGAYNEFIKRHCLGKGFSSEVEALDYFKNDLKVADLLDSERFVLFRTQGCY